MWGHKRFPYNYRRSTMEAIYLLWRLMERYQRKQKCLCMVFIDLEKVYDMVSREFLWKVSGKKEFILPIFDQSKVCMMRIKLVWEHITGSQDFSIIIRLHQGSIRCAYEAYPRADATIYGFCRLYIPSWRIMRGNKWEVRSVKISFGSSLLPFKHK